MCSTGVFFDKDFGSDPRERFRTSTKLKKPEFFEKIDGKEES